MKGQRYFPDKTGIPWDRVRFVADLHIHSRFSRATSQEMTPLRLNQYARLKGIGVMGTGDITHPAYLKELEDTLEKGEDGFYHLKDNEDSVRFVLTGEISNIFSWHGKTYRIHTLIILSDFKEAHELIERLKRVGNVSSDGRPIFGFPVKELLRMVRESSDDFLFIPAHIWTPWFSLFGSRSGFNTIEECFEEETEFIYALETGLSSDPPMNWMCSQLDKYTLVSNSDAHSPQKIGREANCFSCPMTYKDMTASIRRPEKGFLGTIEFFPEEGKYHYDGHRLCGVCLSPEKTRAYNSLCPKCGSPLTIGVMHRVFDLADRPYGYVPSNALSFDYLVPLTEILQEALGVKSLSKKVKREYSNLVNSIAPELDILCKISIKDLKDNISDALLSGIRNMREGNISIEPGHDGKYGVIRVINIDSGGPGTDEVEAKAGLKGSKVSKGRKKAPFQQSLFKEPYN